MRTAIYVRVSTKDKGLETTNQLMQLREYCRALNWTVIQEYEDHDSGGKAERPQFQAMMADASRRQFDVVLFWSLDRFTREGALQTLQHLNQLSSYGIGFRSSTEPYLDSVRHFQRGSDRYPRNNRQTGKSANLGTGSRRPRSS
jgi:DNA invertase Pin-like site-specific DNA recombinase